MSLQLRHSNGVYSVKRTTRPAFLAQNASRVKTKACAKSALKPVKSECTAFAPATVANLGPGFDWLGCAVEGEGDTVVAKVVPDKKGIFIESIEGDGGRLSLDPAKNCIGVAATETLKLIGEVDCGISLKLHKGLPLGSGMGSSAASAAAAAWAVNGLFGSPVSKELLINAGLESEASVSGYHADNIGPSLLGGFILIKKCKRGSPVELMSLPFSKDNLYFVLVNPKFEAPTAKMRAALKPTVPMASLVNNCQQGGALVAGILTGNVPLIGEALDSDVVVEPARAPLIPGMMLVKAAAKAAGAYGCTISGAGPTAVAIVDDVKVGERVSRAMCDAFRAGGLEVNTAKIVRLNTDGAKFV
uniref:Homoserine kinase n=1 Tax=Polytomella parva TaxID=51329 RepID=A0A7S0V4A6_9CHLO|nr:homoserine kinase (KHSE) [Polytomella parva]|mmetsp:Transcript_29467/g.54083  ORF Transcript_29467/g.54083 Transcript_29467/m.54083 type:complete len:359 (+) Transcript_29467:85-1161(+)|eukprot:CAMPEP_0175083766 /NCGR_PEP_ID=MMETSP0052_2-20121109/27596_1 /TAXON_ID=51329 ORGANISM="Polytomella parva, Strain SAG 63-3" /NCGR_SAMPLE_ID=MMETSP0052_2 /ASSEMBLY_ACC=CAM_ASM_000194 /LENGTH=358 /DNA_ID=CAMNT_0016355315 /DNA_START=77 /DNA_END=1153 /DNA_ORIENTATION=+